MTYLLSRLVPLAMLAVLSLSSFPALGQSQTNFAYTSELVIHRESSRSFDTTEHAIEFAVVGHRIRDGGTYTARLDCPTEQLNPPSGGSWSVSSIPVANRTTFVVVAKRHWSPRAHISSTWHCVIHVSVTGYAAGESAFNRAVPVKITYQTSHRTADF